MAVSWSVGLGSIGSEPMQSANGRRLAAGEERFAERPRAAGHRQLAGVGIDVDERDAFGWLERCVGITGERRFHELRPDRQRRLCAAQPYRLVVVEADP